MPRNKTKRNNNQLQSLRTQVNNIKRSMNGSKIRVPADPPSGVQIPWNQLTVKVSIETESASEITVGILRKMILQTIFLEDTHFELKIKSYRAWGPSDHPDSQLMVAAFDLSDVDEGRLEPISVLSDFGGNAYRAKVGYQWPVSQQNQVLVTDVAANTSIIEVENCKIVYIDLLWKPRATNSRRGLITL